MKRRRIIRVAFLAWGIFVFAYLANSMRTRGVAAEMLGSTTTVAVLSSDTALVFAPSTPRNDAALLFFCGSGVTAEAYAPLMRLVADSGYLVVIIKLPYRFAPLESHKQAALARARSMMAEFPRITQWVVSGHSLGGALAARFTAANSSAVTGLVLIGTTHPKEQDLSTLPMPVTKVYALNDGVAPADRVLGNRRLLPAATQFYAIPGGNHSQFGRYGHQLFDGDATISRDEQERLTAAVLLAMLTKVAESDVR